MDSNARILYHLTTDEGYAGIQRDGVIKPGPRNVWVVRDPMPGYIRNGGRIWLSQGHRLNWTVQHLFNQRKYVTVILGVDTSTALPYRLIPGVFYMLEETPSWFFVSRVNNEEGRKAAL